MTGNQRQSYIVQRQGHGAAGEGQSWQPAGGDRAANQRAKSSLGVTMRRTNETLPEGFLNAISHTHVGKQVNLRTARTRMWSFFWVLFLCSIYTV